MDEGEVSASLAYFPLIGLIIGGLLASFDWALRDIFSSSNIIGILDTAWLAILTRGLHLDGLADTIDGLASNAPRERVLEIMRDSRTGAIGVVAIVLILSIKASALSVLSQKDSIKILILVPCLSRFGINMLSFLCPYARDSYGLGRAFTGKRAKWTMVMSLPTSIFAAFFLMKLKGILALLEVILLSAISSIYFNKRLGGITGDVLGAHTEVMEALLFLSFCAMYQLRI